MSSNRRIHLLQLLQTSGPMTALELAGNLGVPERTVRRDISALTAAGIPVRPGAAPADSFRLPDGYRTQLAHARRLAAALQMLHARGRMTGSQLAAALGTSLRTVHRDAAALSAAGIALQADTGTAGGYRLPAGYHARLDGLGAADVQLMVLGALPDWGPAEGMMITSLAYAVDGELPALLLEELHRAHELKTRLAAAAHEHDGRVKAIWAGCPELVGAHGVFDQADSAVRDLNEQAREERRSSPGRRAYPETRAQLRLARARRAEAKEALRAARDGVREELVPQFKAAQAGYRAAIGDICSASVDGGLYWATVNAVSQQYRIAGDQAAGMRSRGMRSHLRGRPWDGTGTVTVQLQRLAAEPARSPARLAAADGRYSDQCLLQPWVRPADWDVMSQHDRHRLQAGTLRIRIGSGELAGLVTLPVVVHRMIPAEADVARVEVTRKLIGTRYRSHVAVIARVPQPSPPLDGQRVAVLACWRELPDGAIRAAVIMGAGPPPRRLVTAGVVRDHGSFAEAVIPASWRELRQRIGKLRAGRAQDRKQMRAWLDTWTAEHPGFGGVLDAGGDLAVGGTDDALNAAAVRLSVAPPPGCSEPAARLAKWRRDDRWLHEWHANEWDQLSGRRDDAWSNIADWLATESRLIMTGQRAAPAPVPRRGAHVDSLEQKAARANRSLVAPSLLRYRITAAARRRGVRSEQVPVPSLPLLHDCGAPLDESAFLTDSLYRCPGCGTEIDPDVDAAARLLVAGPRLK
jgi:biotin operon repressor